MVREVLPRVHIYSLALIVSAFHRASSSKVSPVDCTRFDIAELEDYLSKVHPENLPAIDTMIGKFASPVTELPFGALRSDWRRLLLLRRAQPEGSILREKLGRLFRILAVAYFQTNELSDITEQLVFSTTGSNWDCSTSERAINFEEDQEEAETLGTPLTDSTETNRVSESLTSTTLLSREDASRVSEIDLTFSDTTEPYDKRFDFSTNPIDISSITIRSSTFHTNTIVSSTTQSVENQNSIEEEKSSENLNHSALNRNNSADNSFKSQIGKHIPKLISSTELSATETEEKHINSSTNTIDTSVIDVTSLIIDTNSIISSTTQFVENQNSIEEEKSSENLNHSALDRNNSSHNSFKSQIDEHIPKLISSTELSATETEEKRINSSTNTVDTSVIDVTATIFDANKIARPTTESLANQNTIREDKRLGNFENKEDDDKIDADSQFTTQEYPEINTFNITSTQLSTTGASIERDKSLSNLGKLNNLELDNNDNVANNKVDADSRFTTQEYPEINTFNITSLQFLATGATIERDKSLANFGKLNNLELDNNDDVANNKVDADSRFTTQEYPEINTFNITSSQLTTTGPIIERDKSLSNLGKLNNLELDNDDDLANNKLAADSRFTTQEYQEINTFNITSTQLSTTGPIIERDKSLSNLGKLNNLELDNNDDLANNKLAADSRFTTQEYPEINTFNITSSQLTTTGPIIERDKSLSNLGKLNNLELDNDDDLANNKLAADSRFTTQEYLEINTFNITSSQLSTTGATIERDKSLSNLGKLNNLELDNDDDLANNKLAADSRFTTQEYPEINTFNITSTQLSTTGANIERDKSLANLGKLNNLELDNDDDLANNKLAADSRFTTQEYQEINTFNITSTQLSTTGASIERDKSLSNLGKLNNLELDNDDDLANNKLAADSRFTTQEYQEINTLNITSTLLDITSITTIARSSAESSTFRTIIDGDESSENSKVVPLESPVNENEGTQMAEKETVGFVKDGSSDHFRGAEVATVAAAAAVGGFVASKSSVAGATVEEEDAQPITSPVSESDTPVTPLGSDFSASRIRGYGPGIMNIEPAERIKESGFVLPTSTEIAIARGRGDSPIVYTPMNSEDQENIAEFRGAANTSDPGMTDVKTMIEQSRIDRIRGNEVRDGVLGQEPVRQKDGGSSTPRSIQNSVPYRGKIRKPSVSTEPKVDSGFSSYIVTPRIVASTAASASNRQDRLGDYWSRTGPLRSKKRGSLNTDVEKSYRWFYNIEKEGGRDSDQRGIQIECGENGHGK